LELASDTLSRVAATRARSKTADTKRRSRTFPGRYSHEYPVSKASSHHYSLNAIPIEIWERAKRRAHGEDRAIRVILIRALELYGSGRIVL
jgi:hypothetical protein